MSRPPLAISYPVAIASTGIFIASLASNAWLLTRPPVTSPPSPITSKASPSRPQAHRPAALTLKARSHAAADATISSLDPDLRIQLARDPKAALSFIATTTEGETQIGLLRVAVAHWAKLDPTAAAAWLDLMSPGKAREIAIGVLVSHWASTNGAAAARWLESIKNSARPISDDGWLTAATDLATQWSAQDPGQAVAWSANLSDTRAEGSAYRTALRTWSTAAPAEAQAYFAALAADHALRDIAAEVIGSGMAAAVPAEAFTWALGITDEDSAWQAREAVLRTWSKTHPSVAAAQLAAVADETIKTAHLGTVVLNWAATNADAAEAWSHTLPSGPDRDYALRALSEHYGAMAPPKALELALEISAGELRRETTEGVLAWWREDDLAAAEKWFKSAPLDPELRQALVPTTQ